MGLDFYNEYGFYYNDYSDFLYLPYRRFTSNSFLKTPTWADIYRLNYNGHLQHFEFLANLYIFEENEEGLSGEETKPVIMSEDSFKAVNFRSFYPAIHATFNDKVESNKDYHYRASIY